MNSFLQGSLRKMYYGACASCQTQHDLDGRQRFLEYTMNWCVQKLESGVESKKVGPKEIARCLDKTEKYVYDTIYGAKRILSRAAKG